MEYHEIGERFEYDGVTLEVVECHCGIPCIDCYFRHHRKDDFDCDNSLCRSDERKDKKEVYYIQTRRKCKTKKI